MNRTDRKQDDNEEYLSPISTIESLLIQALINQLTDIVNTQNRKSKITYENAFKQAETLRSLAQTALMLTDSESLHLHGEKIQDFLNRAVLEHLTGVEIDEPN